MSESLLTVVVSKREIQGNHVVVLELSDPDGHQLPAYEAGAHIELHLPNGLNRQYSLCGDPAMHHAYRLGVLKDPASRGGSLAVYDSLLEGTRVQISQPRNLFPLTESSPRSILVGGGIGITPMIAMAYRLSAIGQPFDLWYCAHDRHQCGFIEELQSAPFAGQVHFYFTAEHQGQRIDFNHVLEGQGLDSHVYVCGPEKFMQSVLDAATAHGFNDQNLHREYFNVAVETTGQGFEVVAVQSGITVQVGEHETIAQALKAAGVKVHVACEKGTCGTCLCDVLEGIPDHRDVYLTDDEKQDNDQMTLCCSRSLSTRLVLDI